MKSYLLGAVCACVITLSHLPLSYAAAISDSDFNGGEVIEDFTGLGFPLFNTGSLVLSGITYTTDSGTFRYFSWTGGSFGESIGTDTDDGWLDVSLSTPVKRLGSWIGNSAGRAEFYDTSDNLLGTVTVAGDFALPPIFAGWEADSGLIQRMRVFDISVNNSTILTIDRITTEISSVPIPPALYLFGSGLMGLFGVARRQKV